MPIVTSTQTGGGGTAGGLNGGVVEEFLPPLTGFAGEEPAAAGGEGVFIDSPTAALDADYQVRNYYEFDGHRYMMGVTSPSGFQGQSAAFVQLATKTLLWVADWTAARLFQQPLIPDPDAVSSDWILLDGHYILADVKPGPDGATPFYRITGTYFYGHKNPSAGMVSYLEFGRPAYVQSSAFTRTMPAGNLQPGIITNVSTLRTRGATGG